MADNNSAGGNASKNPGSSNAAPNSAAPSLSKPENTLPGASAPSHSGQRGDRRGGRDHRGRGRDRERGKSRGRVNERGGHQKQELGRSAWSRNPVDKRKRNDQEQATKRQKIEHEGEGAASVPFTKEEIAAEERKPKRKVAVLIGYAGSGYKGMQINASEKTIEGDLFSAFVAAGAISKANADDPKKSSLVRCARTDKGVHAAGNVISLKLIVEDPDVVKKINDSLPPQIRVWGIERTNGSFSCYQACDSRWYEYLIPTYSFLPPHPQSFLGKKLVESAEKEGVFESYQSQQADVASFWKDAEKDYVNPILDRLDPEIRDAVMEAIHSSEDARKAADGVKSPAAEEDLTSKPNGHVTMSTTVDPQLTDDWVMVDSDTGPPDEIPSVPITSEAPANPSEKAESDPPPSKPILTPVEAAIKEVKAAYILAKKAYRISPSRRQRVQEALSAYIGTRNFHNYTIQKSFKDPSARRIIRSFTVSPSPIIINNTEWLSLKVHGQSFMMHQIRKMVAMVALIVRCGAPLSRISDSYGSDNISIPKAPGLGLLLERPVFETYNERAVREFQKEKIDFARFEKEIAEFKQREIYERIFREEERDHQFHIFFHHIDHYRTNAFLWVTSTGIPAARQALGKAEVCSEAVTLLGSDSEDEADGNGGNEEG